MPNTALHKKYENVFKQDKNSNTCILWEGTVGKNKTPEMQREKEQVDRKINAWLTGNLANAN